MKNRLLWLLMLIPYLCSAQDTLSIWPDGCPDSNGIQQPEKVVNDRISNVSIPWITVYKPIGTANTGAAVLICPGGGYAMQAAGHEGKQVAQWLASKGITAFVLKYRLPNRHAILPLEDAKQAMRIIRKRASEWNISPEKIGVCGFSAGGHLAASLATHFDTLVSGEYIAPSPVSCRPDFALLFYPVISMDKKLTHAGSRDNLLGSECSQEIIESYSCEKQVRSNTPPTLLLLSDDDRTVLPANSLAYYQALKAANIPASVYIFPEGGHGWGFNASFKYHEDWKKLMLNWLSYQKII